MDFLLGTEPIAIGDLVLTEVLQGFIRQGRLLPTTSVEQLAAILGTWLGVSDSELLALLPNLTNYNLTARNLGFV